MPPKAKPGKKLDLPSEKELLQRAEAELLALRRLLELKSHEVNCLALTETCNSITSSRARVH